LTVQPPPIYENLQDEIGKAKTPWALFFNQIYNGDSGTNWNPTFTSLGTTGSPTITGRYFRLSEALKVFNITIDPATDTSSTAGTTYCDNFPLTVNNTGFCVAVGGAVGVGTGIVTTAGRIYTPEWTDVTVPVNVIGLVEAN